MGKVYFHSPSGDAMLRGSERAHAGQLVNKLACAVLPLYDRDGILPLLPPGCYLWNLDRAVHFAEDFQTWMSVGSDANFHLPSGVRVSTFTVALNTALVMGSRPVKLLARLHGQCEIHTWVDGPNRAWLADIIGEGRKSGVLRDDQGWEKVVELLRQRDDEAVVTSFSVCEQFPSPPESWEYRENEAEKGCFGPDGQGWDTLSHNEQWNVAMDALRCQGQLELEPDGFDDFWFGGEERITMFDIDRMRQEIQSKEDKHF